MTTLSGPSSTPSSRRGDTYVFDPQTPRAEALAYWFRPDTHTYVAEIDGCVVGTCILEPNQPALGSHVANAAFMVLPACARLSVGRRMGEHCVAKACRLGFRAMQFKLRGTHERGGGGTLAAAHAQRYNPWTWIVSSRGKIVQLGVAPNRVALMTAIDGVAFDEAWADRVPGGRATFLKNKRAAGRPQDVADIDVIT